MKRILCLALALCMLLTAAAFADQEAEKQLEKEIGAFEITAEQREKAKTNAAGYPVLDAGRGNPNWINAQARYAFTRLMEYAVGECELTMNGGGMAGQAKRQGIGARFDAAMDPNDPTDAFLTAAVDLCVNTLGLDKDGLLKELVDAIIGDYYPSPQPVPAQHRGDPERVFAIHAVRRRGPGRPHGRFPHGGRQRGHGVHF